MKLIGLRRAAVLGTAAASCIALAACSSSGGGSNGGGTIKLAFEGPLTGDNGQYGQDQTQGMQLAVDQYNAAGGVPSDPNQGASVAQQLCDDSSLFAALGPVNSSVALAVGPIYNRCGLTEVISYASNPKITTAGYTNVFRTIPNDDQLSAADVDAAVQVAGKSKIAIVWSNDDYGQGLFAGAKNEAAKLGVSVVADQSFTSGSTKDFSSILTKIKSSNPDALLLMTTYSDAGLLANQARQAGINAQIVVPTGSNTPQSIKLAGSAADGVLTPVLFNPDSSDPQVAKFVKDFKAKYKRDPGESSGLGFASVQLIEYALEQGATTRQDLSAKLSAGKAMPTITGPITFDKNRDPSSLSGLTLLTVKNGKFVANDKQFAAK